MEGDVKFTPKEQKFIEEYVKCLNAAQAARLAGYSKHTAREIGCENLTKPHIRKKVDELIKSASMTAEETKKIISDIATANLSNYLKPVKVERCIKIEKGLQLLIDELRAEIEFEDEYALEVNLRDKELTNHMKGQEARRRQIIRYKLELKKNPDAYRIVDGPYELVDDMELDLVALTKDKEGARIKSLKQGKYGIEVDLADSANMITNMGRVHSLFVDKSEVDLTANVDTVTRIGYGDSENNKGT